MLDRTCDSETNEPRNRKKSGISMFSRKLLVSLICGSMISLQAMADIPPPPGSIKPITVEFASSLSELLVQSTAFQSTEDVQLPREGAWGPCTVKKSIWKQTSSNPSRRGETSITCMTATSCFYKAKPVCTATFRGHPNENADSLLKILK